MAAAARVVEWLVLVLVAAVVLASAVALVVGRMDLCRVCGRARTQSSVLLAAGAVVLAVTGVAVVTVLDAVTTSRRCPVTPRAPHPARVHPAGAAAPRTTPDTA